MAFLAFFRLEVFFLCIFESDTAVALRVDVPKQYILSLQSTYIGSTLRPVFKAKVYTIWVHGPSGEIRWPPRHVSSAELLRCSRRCMRPPDPLMRVMLREDIGSIQRLVEGTVVERIALGREKCNIAWASCANKNLLKFAKFALAAVATSRESTVHATVSATCARATTVPALA